jgi:hypothetical protein
MAKTTVFFGIVLILLGAASFILTGQKFPTSLIPVGFGILLVIFGGLAGRPGTRHLKLFMHIAVTIGLLGFLGTAASLVDLVRLLQGKIFPYPAAVEEKAAMAALTLIFVILCVRSFIAARRTGVRA